jgi:Fe2+ or Zn2+ uptake regulation protein
MKLAVHAWEIDGYVNVKSSFKEFLEKKIKERYKTFCNFHRTLGLSSSIYRFFKLKEGFLPIWKLFKVAQALNIPPEKIEKNIILFKDSTNTQIYSIKFPFKITLPMFRIILHLPGDGCYGCKVASKKTRSLRHLNYWIDMRWSQKDITPMKKLLAKIFPEYKTLNNELIPLDKEINIPAFLIKIFISAFRIQPHMLKKSDFINLVLKLPKEYRVQALVAIIEDEGTISIASHHVRIFNTDKNLLKSYASIADSLGYERSRIFKQENEFFKTKFYFNIYTSGLRKFAKDIEKICKKYEKLLDFWKKKRKFERLIKAITTPNAIAYEIYRKEATKLRKKIIKLLQANKILKLSEICRKLGLNPRNKMEEKKIETLLKRTKEIIRVKRGYYALKGQIQKTPKYFDSREGILSLLSKKPMDAKSIIKELLKENIVKDKSSIYVRLKKLRNEGKIVLINGIYTIRK